MQSVILAYTLKLYPTRNKADTLANLASLFRRAHTDCTLQIAQAEEARCPSTKGLGEFIGRAYRRAWIDWQRTTKAGHTPGHLQAELIDSAEIQQPRKAKGFDCWIMVRGTTASRGRHGGFYVPARRHRAINRTLALPGARLNESAEVFRKNGKWYARVSVSVPLAEVQRPKGWLGCDVGVRAAVTRSDGYRGPDLRPILKRKKERLASQQRDAVARESITHQRQILAGEARRAVSVAQRSGRGVSLEDPKRLIRWRQHAARYFGQRVRVLAALMGVCVQEINPAYTSTTCSCCGLVNRDMRHKEAFRCWHCGFTHNADFNAALNIATRAHGYCHSHKVSLSPSPGGVGADK